MATLWELRRLTPETREVGVRELLGIDVKGGADPQR
jgi:hypothetical protein